MELEIHERNDDGLILTSFAGASYGYLWETEVEARMFKKLCESRFELDEEYYSKSLERIEEHKKTIDTL